MAKREDKAAVDVSELQDHVADLEDGVADALEHLRSGRLERAIRTLEKIEPEPENEGT